MEYLEAHQLLVFKAELEALITEREGMIAENKWLEVTGHIIKYGEEQFSKLQDRINGLLTAIQNSRYQ